MAMPFTLLPEDPANVEGVAAPNTPAGEATTPPENREVERREVKKLMNAYDSARKFDKAARAQYAKDRRYAAGVADIAWVVTVNLIGSFIDVLSSYLYARNPDVSVRKAEQVDQVPDPDRQAFAKTLELVIARLWKRARLKTAIKRSVRSALSVGPGWFKVIMITDRRTDPQVQAAINDAQDNLQRLAGLQKKDAYKEVADPEVAKAEQEKLIRGLQAKLEVLIFKGLAIDFCSAEDVQVALNVRDLEEYLESEWIANAIYRPRADLEGMFPRLSCEELKDAATYHQRHPAEQESGYSGAVTEHDAETFGKEGTLTHGVDGDPVEFAKIIEVWDRRDNLVKTMIDGVHAWAKEPYPPPQASSRFFPFFYLAFFEVDGSRHPQSLSRRLRKLQDEYSATRSSARINRQRSVPGILFNSEQVDAENARKLERGVEQEYVGIKLTNPNIPMRDVFTEKPYARMDPMLFDTSAVLHDMEKLSGVQEALQSSVVQPKTATEAEIQQSGFAARTTADRDTQEDVLNDLAQYTAELSVQAMSLQDARRIAGPHAFWPEGMDIEDLLTMVEVDITAGSTGKPNTSAEREAWSVAMPLIKGTMLEIQAARAQGNEPMARALTELLRETLGRMGDRIEVERFIPELPGVVAGGAMPGVPGVPAMPGVEGAPGVAPPPAGGNGASVVPPNPVLQAPSEVM
jgi:hypothetical protein